MIVGRMVYYIKVPTIVSRDTVTNPVQRDSMTGYFRVTVESPILTVYHATPTLPIGDYEVSIEVWSPVETDTLQKNQWTTLRFRDTDSTAPRVPLQRVEGLPIGSTFYFRNLKIYQSPLDIPVSPESTGQEGKHTLITTI